MDWSVNMYGLEHEKMGRGSATVPALGGLQKTVRRAEDIQEILSVRIFVGPIITMVGVKDMIYPYIASSNKSPTIPPLVQGSLSGKKKGHE